jgi:hypothetical protein
VTCGAWLRSVVSVTWLLAGLAGCPSFRSGAHDTLDEFSKEENWEKLKKPARALVAEVVSGTFDALRGGDLKDRLLEDYVVRFMKVASAELDADLGPAAARQVRATVASVMDELLSDKVRVGAAQAAETITRAAVASLGSAAAGELSTHLGPQLAATLEHVLVPAMARSLNEDLGPALAKIIRDDVMHTLATSLQTDLQPRLVGLVEQSANAASRGFIDGAVERLDPVIDKARARLEAALARLEATAQTGKQGAQSVFYSIVGLVLALVIGIVGALAISRQYRLNDARAALRLVTSEIRDLDPPQRQELKDRIQRQGVKYKQAGVALASFLEQNRELKIPKTAAEARRGEGG